MDGASTTQAPPSEDEITPVLDGILRTNDLSRLTLRIVMQKLTEHFQVESGDMAVRKKFVRRAIENFMATVYVPEPEENGAAKDHPSSSSHAHVKSHEVEHVEEEEVQAAYSDSDSDRPAPKKRKKRASATGAAPKLLLPKTVHLTNLEKAVVLAEPLANFLGEVVLPRTHVPKRIQQYVKEKNLQDPSDRRVIRCDDALKEVFQTDSFTFFSMAKYISPLLYKVDEIQDEELKKLVEECNAKRLAEKQKEYDERVARGEEVPSPKRPKLARGSRSSARVAAAAAAADGEKPKKRGLNMPMKLSQPLAAVCGEETMSRPEVVKRIWEYIRANQLQQNGKIQCDAKLQAIFEGHTEVTNFGFNKFLTQHLTRVE